MRQVQMIEHIDYIYRYIYRTYRTYRLHDSNHIDIYISCSAETSFKVFQSLPKKKERKKETTEISHQPLTELKTFQLVFFQVC